MTTSAALQRIIAFRLTTNDPGRLLQFYTAGLGFSPGAAAPIPSSEMALLSLGGGGSRSTLILGDQQLDLDQFEEKGRLYPADATAADRIFQHFALVVTDIASTYLRALTHGATAISSNGPVVLPPSAGGVIAVKFRDPEGHPLELLQFQADPPEAWRQKIKSGGVLGIDHSAISVTDADASARFYEGHGLRLGRRTLNHGETQAQLDGLPTPQVDVVPLKPALATPHLELLGYRSPRGRPPAPAFANDIAATRIVWASAREGLLKDPDGHLHQLVRRS